ncbi:MFS transporter [Phytohabitans houttuyneae]|uniref:MDR family MFS transporter n=1 Tax=Phytohabitans houttuyneae TaxID=1076126 RepID=UPI0031E9E1C9
MTAPQRGLPKAFWVLWAGTLINRMGTMVVPFMTLYLVEDRGISVLVAGGVMAAFGAGSLVSQLLGGVLADRIGRRATLLAGTCSTAVLMVALAYTRHVAAIVALVLALGVTIDLYRPASQALVADLIPPAGRARAFGLLFLAANVGFASAMAAAGFLAARGFTVLFWADAITGALFGLLIWWLVPETRPRRGTAGSPGGFRVVLRDRTMVAFTACVFGYYFVYYQSDMTLPLAMRENGVSASVYGLCMALNGLLICIVQPFIGPWLGRPDPGRVWAAGVALVGLGYGLTAAAHSAPAYFATVAIWTLGEILPAAVTGVIVARLSPEHLRGRYAGFQGMAWSGGWLAASVGGSGLFSISPVLLWMCCAAACALAASGLLALSPRIRRREDATVPGTR